MLEQFLNNQKKDIGVTITATNKKKFCKWDYVQENITISNRIINPFKIVLLVYVHARATR